MEERKLNMAKWLGGILMMLMFVLIIPGSGNVRAAETGGQWIQEGDRWRYQLVNGSYVKGTDTENPTCKFINRKKYYFDADGYMMTGWISVPYYDWKNWYYADSNGALLTGWQQIGSSWYYFDLGGEMERNRWIDGYYLNPDGVWTDGTDNPSRWVLDEHGWRYQYPDGSYVKNDLYFWISDQSGDKWYGFDENGYMITGWCNSRKNDPANGQWHYYNPDGSGAEGWQLINGVWYCFRRGIMYQNCWIGSCYVDRNGAWDPTANSRNNDDNHVTHYNIASGQWIQDENGWWYQFADGGYPADYSVRINGTWYCFDKNGYMITGWYQIGEDWYYADASGARLTGWQQINGTWYYFVNPGYDKVIHLYWDAGVMVHDAYVDGYYLNHDGAWSSPPTHATKE